MGNTASSTWTLHFHSDAALAACRAELASIEDAARWRRGWSFADDSAEEFLGNAGEYPEGQWHRGHRGPVLTGMTGGKWHLDDAAATILARWAEGTIDTCGEDATLWRIRLAHGTATGHEGQPAFPTDQPDPMIEALDQAPSGDPLNLDAATDGAAPGAGMGGPGR